MESVSKIRRWVLVEGRSIRSVSRSTGLSRNTIKKYLKDESPPSYQRQAPPVRHKLCNGFDLRLQELFDQDQKRPRRERRTAQKLYEQLVVEGYTGSYSPVQRFVRDLKRAGAGSGDAFIPLHFAAGDALQFDWSEERVVLGGVEQKVKVAHFRLCHSRKPFVVAYPGESQEMVLDAFVRALSFYSGVPRRVIIDNPKTMVIYVSRSKDRVFHPRFLALMNHYVMEPVACTPAAGWEKGQVENQVGVVRRRFFVPRPKFKSYAELNAWLEDRCVAWAKANPHQELRDRTIWEVFQDERASLVPYVGPFDGFHAVPASVSKTCLVRFDKNRYSVDGRAVDHCAARPPDPSLRHRRNRQRELALQDP